MCIASDNVLLEVRSEEEGVSCEAFCQLSLPCMACPKMVLSSCRKASKVCGYAGRRSEHGARMGEREHGRSRDSEASRHSSASWHRDRSSDSGFRSEGPSRYPSGPLPPMGSSGLPLSPSQGPMPGGERTLPPWSYDSWVLRVMTLAYRLSAVSQWCR